MKNSLHCHSVTVYLILCDTCRIRLKEDTMAHLLVFPIFNVKMAMESLFL